MNRLALGLTVVAVALLLAASVVVLRFIDSAQRDYTRSHTLAGLATVVGQARQMAEDDMRRVATFAEVPALLALTTRILDQPKDTAAFETLWQSLEPIYRSRGFVGVSLISADGMVVAATSPAFVGFNTRGTEAESVLLRARLYGAAISPPMVSPLPVTLYEDTEPAGTLLQLACARLLDGAQLRGYFCLRADPHQRLFRFLQASRSGRSGEAYAVNGKGQIISPSRFSADQLPVSAGPSRLIELLLRNKSTGTGYQENYRDYRGVAVVGAAQWLPEIGMGVVVEEDYDEAFYAARIASIAVATLTAIAIALLVALMLVQRALRRRVERREHQLRAFTEHSPNSVVMWDTDGRVLLANRTFERLLGVASGEAVGKISRELVGRDWQAFSRERMKAVVERGETIRRTVTTEDGGKVFDVTSFPVRSEEAGELLGVGSIAVDVSEQARIRLELEDLNRDLETRVAERTEELSRARDAAEAAARSKAEFLANMSHEIRTPLNAVIGMSQLAQRSSRDPGIAQHLRRIHDAGQHLLGIVNGILDFSSLEAGATAIASEAFSLAHVVEHSIGLNSEQAAAKGLALSTHIEPGTPDNLVGDQLHLAQILTNLLSNAIKFTNHGEVTLRLSVAARDDDSVHLRIAVSDTGIGIPSHKLGELFQPFHQLDTSLARRHEGTGLGLVITRRLVHLMAGTIDVVSVENRGTEFTVELPFALATVNAAPIPASASALCQGPHPELIGRHLLLVEDNPINRDVAKEMLSLFGASVATAADGMQALQTLNTDLFDLVLMDLHMPVMDGVEATAAMRRDPRFAALPVIALTADVMSENQSALRAAGVNAVLNKPLDADRLLAELIRWLPPRIGTASTNASAAASSMPERSRLAVDDDSALLLAQLRAVPDINVDAALERMLNRCDIYQAFVRNVVAATTDTDVKLRAAVAADDKEAIHDVVHGLKSLYASLGADDIALRCGVIERELMEGGYTAERIDSFIEAWQPLHEKLSRICTASAAAEDRQRRVR